MLVAFMVVFSATAQNKEKAESLIKEVSANIKSYKNITATFDYNYQGTEYSGEILVEGDKYFVELNKTILLSDGVKTYAINNEDKEVMISKTTDKANSGAITPSRFFTFFNTGYTYYLEQVKTIAGRDVQYVKLVPKDSKSSTRQVLVGIYTKTKTIYSIEEMFKDGNKSTLKIKSFKTNLTLSKNQFTFTESKYPNYYIIKLD